MSGTDEADEALSSEIEAMTSHPRLSRAVKASLERLRSGSAGPEMADMAKGLLEGRLKLRNLATNSAYADPLMEGIDRYRRWERELSPEDRTKLAEQVRETYGP